MDDALEKRKAGRPAGAGNKNRREFTRTLRDAAEKYRLASVVVQEWEAAKADMSPSERFRASLDLASLVVRASPREAVVREESRSGFHLVLEGMPERAIAAPRGCGKPDGTRKG